MSKIIDFFNNRIIKNEKRFFGVVVILFCILFFSLYFFTAFPFTQGWGQNYVELMEAGKFPYRDFYYYIPPFNLLIDWLFWKISFGHFIIYGLLRFVERTLIFYLMYKLLCKLVKPRYACLGTCVGITMMGAVIWDLIGDYNQTTLLFIIILTSIYVKYIGLFDTKEKMQYVCLFFGGFLIGLSFLLKQPLFIAEGIIFFPLLTINFILKKKKGYIKSLLISIIGIIIPIVATLIVLYLNNALTPFIDQVYKGATGKGSIYTILTVLFTACFKYKYLLLTLLSTILIYNRYKYYKINNKLERNINKNNTLIILLILLSTFLFVYNDKISSFDYILNTKLQLFGLFLILICVIIDLATKKNNNNNSPLVYFIYISMLFLFITSLVIKPNGSIKIYNNTQAYSLLYEITTLGTMGVLVYIIYSFVKNKKYNNPEMLKWQFVFAGALVYEYVSAMGSTDSLHTAGSTMIIAVLISFLLHKLGEKDSFTKYIIICLSLFIVGTVASQKIVNAYSWWGWNEEVLKINEKYSINIPGLEGYRVSKNTKNMYEKMYRVLKENSDSKSVIYGFPHVKIFNVLLHNTNMNNFVPVPFYDVTADKYATDDAKLLKKNPPDIVIWVDMPDCMEIHENIFRGGKPLGQRNIQKWFSKAVANKEYILIGQYDNIFIYKLDDGSKINYKYIKNKKAVNKTIKIKKKQSKKNKSQ